MGIATGVQLATDGAALDYESVLNTTAEELVSGGVDYGLKRAPIIRHAPETVRAQIKAVPETVYNLINASLELSE